ncbi:MAG: LytR/AlgR family response regulator transcription factor [Gemmatimonadota bacterium]
MRVRCLIADDEPLGRERIAGLLRGIPEAEIVGLCADGAEALELVEREHPDLLFLDVQMPELDGFAVVAAIPPEIMPEIIFVTVHDQYALRAFEVHAQDYLLKPFDPDRLVAAFARAAQRITGSREHAREARRLRALVDDIERRRTRRTRVPVRSERGVRLLPVGEIDWIEASDNHVLVHAAGEAHPIRQTLQAMEESLPPADFIRVHRSVIVNVTRIREIRPWGSGEYVLALRDGSEVRTSRSYRGRLEALMR